MKKFPLQLNSPVWAVAFTLTSVTLSGSLPLNALSPNYVDHRELIQNAIASDLRLQTPYGHGSAVPLPLQTPDATLFAKAVFVAPKPPNRGAPAGGQRRGAASRGQNQCGSTSETLTALVPSTTVTPTPGESSFAAVMSSIWGLTTVERPTLWFDVPFSMSSDLRLEFVLQDEEGNDVYQKTFTAADVSSGVVSLKLPETVDPLETDKMYHWYFLAYCSDHQPTFVDGWIQRVAIAPDLNSELEKATPQERVNLYAANGIWFDAIATLGELRRQNPENPSLQADWAELLQSVDLEAIAKKPITPCCTLSEPQE